MGDFGYHCFFSVPAALFIASLPQRKHSQFLAWAESLTKPPFRVGDSADSEGRMIENLSIGGCIFSFWVDHKACEVQITEIIFA